jgi:hypothetical protein
MTTKNEKELGADVSVLFHDSVACAELFRGYAELLVKKILDKLDVDLDCVIVETKLSSFDACCASMDKTASKLIKMVDFQYKDKTPPLPVSDFIQQVQFDRWYTAASCALLVGLTKQFQQNVSDRLTSWKPAAARAQMDVEWMKDDQGKDDDDKDDDDFDEESKQDKQDESEPDGDEESKQAAPRVSERSTDASPCTLLSHRIMCLAEVAKPARKASDPSTTQVRESAPRPCSEAFNAAFRVQGEARSQRQTQTGAHEQVVGHSLCRDFRPFNSVSLAPRCTVLLFSLSASLALCVHRLKRKSPISPLRPPRPPRRQRGQPCCLSITTLAWSFYPLWSLLLDHTFAGRRQPKHLQPSSQQASLKQGHAGTH